MSTRPRRRLPASPGFGRAMRYTCNLRVRVSGRQGKRGGLAAAPALRSERDLVVEVGADRGVRRGRIGLGCTADNREGRRVHPTDPWILVVKAGGFEPYDRIIVRVASR